MLRPNIQNTLAPFAGFCVPEMFIFEKRPVVRMKKLLTCLLFLPCLWQAQSEFEKYGPYGVEVYKDLKLALKIGADVQKMDLSFQELDTKYWPKIGKLSGLQALHLSGNTGNISFPAEFDKLNNLVYLASFGNAFKSFPDFKSFPNMMYMEFTNTKIDSIPGNIAYMQRLQTFKFTATDDTLRLTKNMRFMKSLHHLVFEGVVLDSCPRPLFRIPSLKILSAKSCKIQGIPEDLSKLGGLESLYLDNNQITVLPRGIFRMKKLTVLSLRNNKLTKIPDTICHLQNLAHLDLRGNTISAENLEEIKTLLPGCKVYY